MNAPSINRHLSERPVTIMEMDEPCVVYTVRQKGGKWWIDAAVDGIPRRWFTAMPATIARVQLAALSD